jgi:iron(III) transport system substrate-binding protein
LSVPSRADRVVVYSAAEKRYLGPLTQAFAEAYPDIELDFIDGISVALQRRFLERREAGEPDADVMWSSAMDLQVELADCDHTSVHATTLEPLVTLARRDAITEGEPLGSIDEIAQAIERQPRKFRGHVASYDIEANGLGFLAMLAESRDAARFERFLTGFEASGPHPLFGSNPTLVDALVEGRAVVAPHVLGAYALRAADTHRELVIAPTASPCWAISRLALVPADAPNPAGGRAFVEFLLGDAGQAALARAGLNPVRGGVLPKALASVTLVPIAADASLIELDRRAAMLARWRAAVGRK